VVRCARRVAQRLTAVVDVTPQRFAELVGDALDALPEDLGHAMRNVAVTIDDDTPPGRLLGLYEGIPLTRRTGYGESGFVLPDRITLYRQAICRQARSEAEVVQQVQITVVHEVGHHFGIGDERLRELGWG